MIRVWRSDAGPLLIAFMLIDVAIWTYTETAGARINAHIDLTAQQVAWTAFDALLVWRVWRGGRVARAVLLGLSILALAQDAHWRLLERLRHRVVRLRDCAKP